MCGLAGLLGASAGDAGLLGRMAATIAHRGPDDGGVWIDADAGVGFAHRRLSIVDLSEHGHQPMLSSDGRYVISYNGEIYNHADLRTELEAENAGPEGGWRGHSDTETLLQAIVAWGLEPALAKSAGMFAFALYDRADRVVHLVRDRFGEKPLYYGWVGRDFIFASELKAFRAHPGFRGEIDRRALQMFASRTHVPAPWSIYRRIFKLPAASILTISASALPPPLDEPPTEENGGASLRLRSYWSYRDVVNEGIANPIRDEAEALDRLETALGTAIRGQSLADVPVGAFLSGGIDSSTVVALYQKYSDTPVRTFSIGFEEAGFNEAAHAKAVANHLGTIHHEHYVGAAEARDVIPLLPSIYDEPFADSSQIPTFLVSSFAREKVTVALTGDGGDEMFGGYNRHVQAPRLWNGIQGLPVGLRSVAGKGLAWVPPRFWSGAVSLLGRRAQPWAGSKFQKAFRVASTARSFEDVYDSFLDEWSHEATPVRDGRASENFRENDVCPAAPDAVRTMYRDAVGYLPDDILHKVDRASMAVSLETRVPFLDHRVAAMAARIPLDLKIRNGTGKYILRELLYRQAPRSLFERPKAGFAVPVGEWLRGPLRPWAEEYLEPRRLAAAGWFEPGIVQRRWREHLRGRRDSTAALWAVLVFQTWLETQERQAAAAA